MCTSKRKISHLVTFDCNKRVRIGENNDITDNDVRDSCMSMNESSITRRRGILTNGSKLKRSASSSDSRVKFNNDVSVSFINQEDVLHTSCCWYSPEELKAFQSRNRCLNDEDEHRTNKLRRAMKYLTVQFIIHEQRRQTKQRKHDLERLKSFSKIFGSEAMLMALQRGLDNAIETQQIFNDDDSVVTSEKKVLHYSDCMVMPRAHNTILSREVFDNSNKRCLAKIHELMKKKTRQGRATICYNGLVD